MSKKQDKIRELAKLRMERLTFDECAQALNMSSRHAKRLAATPEFKAEWQALEDFWRTTASANTKEAAREAVVTLVGVMRNSRSDLARVQAAKIIGDWANLGNISEEQKSDDKEELDALLRILHSRTTVVIETTPQSPPPHHLLETNYIEVDPVEVTDRT